MMIKSQPCLIAQITYIYSFHSDSAIMPSLSLHEVMDFLQESFDVILVLTSDHGLGPHQLQGHPKNNNSPLSLCRWNVSGVDVWVEANKCDQAVYAALKGVDYEGFGRLDLLGPLKNTKGRDVQETAVPSIYP